MTIRTLLDQLVSTLKISDGQTSRPCQWRAAADALWSIDTIDDAALKRPRRRCR